MKAKEEEGEEEVEALAMVAENENKKRKEKVITKHNNGWPHDDLNLLFCHKRLALGSFWQFISCRRVFFGKVCPEKKRLRGGKEGERHFLR